MGNCVVLIVLNLFSVKHPPVIDNGTRFFYNVTVSGAVIQKSGSFEIVVGYEGFFLLS